MMYFPHVDVLNFLAPPRLHFDNAIVICTSICVKLFSFFIIPLFKDRDSLLSSMKSVTFFFLTTSCHNITTTLHRHRPKTFSLFPHIMEISFFLLNLIWQQCIFCVCVKWEKWWLSYYFESGCIISVSQLEQIVDLMLASFRFLTRLAVERFLFLSIFLCVCLCFMLEQASANYCHSSNNNIYWVPVVSIASC